MSVKQMAKVWMHEFPHNKQSVMLALADHADHNGKKIFPSIALVAWKTGYSEKQAGRIMKLLIEDGILVRSRKHAQHRPNEYEFDWSKATLKKTWEEVRGDILTPLKKKPEGTFQNARVDISDTRLDTAESPEPSFEPSIKKEKIKDISFKINPDLNSKLDKIKAHFKETVPLNSYNEMIDPLIVKSLNGKILTLVCLNIHHQNWIEGRIINMKGYLNIFKSHFDNINLKIKLVLMEGL